MTLEELRDYEHGRCGDRECFAFDLTKELLRMADTYHIAKEDRMAFASIAKEAALAVFGPEIDRLNDAIDAADEATYPLPTRQNAEPPSSPA